MVSIRLHQISKRFPDGVLANDNISLSTEAGEIHAILGENGAGKTTLMKILAGFHRPDSGQVEINGKAVSFQSPMDAKRAGIGMVHQHFSLVPALTVGENLALSADRTSFFFRPGQWTRYVRERAESLGFNIRPDAQVWQLSMGERQRVEIFRLVLEGARILVLDEPTSILAPQEAARLFEHLLVFAKAGHTVLLVTHKIQHVKASADQVTVLRRGRVVATRKVVDLSEAELAGFMVGPCSQPEASGQARKKHPPGGDVLRVQDLSVEPLACLAGLRNVSFTLREGEILGVAGISGNGQDELVAALTGAARFGGSISQPIEKVGYIPADRNGVGVAGDLSVHDNLLLREYADPAFSIGPFLRGNQMREVASARIAAYNIQPPDPGAETSRLSGGNIQKVILARELAREPDFLLAVTPTAGLDLATVDLVHAELTRHADGGAAVLLVSEDLDELRKLCTRILVLFEGRVMGVFDPSCASARDIGLAMSGLTAPAAPAAFAVPGESMLAAKGVASV
jgi:general nucleoside transport system ATP-binding protein